MQGGGVLHVHPCSWKAWERKKGQSLILNNYNVPHLSNCVFASNVLHCSVHHSITVLDLAAWHVQKTTLKSTRRVHARRSQESFKTKLSLRVEM